MMGAHYSGGQGKFSPPIRMNEQIRKLRLCESAAAKPRRRMTEPLWQFAVSRYQRAGVAERCLYWQANAGADVNMLLTATWLAEKGQCWQQQQVRELIAHCADWREHCILPLRAVRQYLKGQPLYEQAKALELDAEIHQLHQLHDSLQSMLMIDSDASPTDALITNLRRYFDCIAGNSSAFADADLRALIDTLIQ